MQSWVLVGAEPTSTHLVQACSVSSEGSRPRGHRADCHSAAAEEEQLSNRGGALALVSRVIDRCPWIPSLPSSLESNYLQRKVAGAGWGWLESAPSIGPETPAQHVPAQSLRGSCPAEVTQRVRATLALEPQAPTSWAWGSESQAQCSCMAILSPRMQDGSASGLHGRARNLPLFHQEFPLQSS